nr:unnamed protein product [Naegleria fowleri]
MTFRKRANSFDASQRSTSCGSCNNNNNNNHNTTTMTTRINTTTLNNICINNNSEACLIGMDQRNIDGNDDTPEYGRMYQVDPLMRIHDDHHQPKLSMNLSEQELQELKQVQSFKSNEIEIVSKIATGGFSEVYQVKIEHSMYAGKKMLANRAQLERNIQKFKDELLVMNRLWKCGCKKITKLVGYCFENPVFWIVMEFMDLGDLHSIIHFKTSNESLQRENQINVNKMSTTSDHSGKMNIRSNEEIELIKSIQTDFRVKMKLAHDMALALMEIHEKSKYAHLDVKSLNFLIDKELNVRIADFCDSKIVDMQQKDQLTSFQPHGTIYWMAPEVMKQSKFCKKSDVYSLSIVFCEILTLSKPYPGMNVLDVKEKIERNTSPPFRMNIVEMLKSSLIIVDEYIRYFIQIIEDMWKEDVSERLSSKQVVGRMKILLEKMSLNSEPLR